MLRVLLWIIVMSGVIGGTLKWLLIQFGTPFWVYYVVLPVLALLCYTATTMLTGYFIEKKAPEFASKEVVFGNVQKWELTAGLGIVPKWVSFIGLMSFSCLLALLLPLVLPLFK